MRLILGAALLALTACGTAPSPRAAVPSATINATPSASSAPSEPTPPTSPATTDPAALVQRADNLYGTYVRRTGSTYVARSLWGVSCDHDSCPPAILVSSTGGPAADRYRPGSYERLLRHLWPSRPPGAPDGGGCTHTAPDVTVCIAYDGALTRTADDGATWEPVSPPFSERLMSSPVVSMAEGVEAVVGGGDGATLFPFEEVARLWSADRTTSYPVEKLDGARGYSSGAVVLSDGRVLTLLADWSDDRRQPAERHHGLWVSDGDDWASYRPFEPVFSPPLTPPPGGASALRVLSASIDPDPVIWAQTWDNRVYVSTDDAATFTELRIR